jgi:hypothetical protein
MTKATAVELTVQPANQIAPGQLSQMLAKFPSSRAADKSDTKEADDACCGDACTSRTCERALKALELVSAGYRDEPPRQR